MSSDELKVPSQRHDVTEDDHTDKDHDPDNDHGNDHDPGNDAREHIADDTGNPTGNDRDPAGRNDLADDEELARSEARTEQLPRTDDEPVVSGSRVDDEPVAGATRFDDVPATGSPRAADEYAAAVPGAVPAPAPGGAYDDDPSYRDPYARTGGDMLTEPGARTVDDDVDPAHATPAATGETPAHAAPDDIVLFDQDPTQVQARWRDLQASFVDDPGQAVQRADGLVGEVVESLTSTLTSRTSALRDRWKDAESTDTEQLRLALRDYRTVLERLLALSSKSPGQFQSQGMR
ncbi:hypothetical protein [Nonomuraea sp. KM90]|uniref:hypothetical protein n=1 Tax=Nonomuraea sp. KM90 TaxID=3457428 RepID=UPI003FCCF7AF